MSQELGWHICARTYTMLVLFFFVLLFLCLASVFLFVFQNVEMAWFYAFSRVGAKSGLTG